MVEPIELSLVVVELRFVVVRAGLVVLVLILVLVWLGLLKTYAVSLVTVLAPGARMVKVPEYLSRLIRRFRH